MIDSPNIANAEAASYFFSLFLAMRAQTSFLDMEEEFPWMRHFDSLEDAILVVEQDLEGSGDGPVTKKIVAAETAALEGRLMASGKANALVRGGAMILRSSMRSAPETAHAKRAFLLAGGTPPSSEFWFFNAGVRIDEDFVEKNERSNDGAKRLSALEQAVRTLYSLSPADRECFPFNVACYSSLIAETLLGRYDVSRSHRSRSAWAPHVLARFLEIPVASPLSTPDFCARLDGFAEKSGFGRLFKRAFVADCLSAFSVSDVDLDLPYFLKNGGSGIAPCAVGGERGVVGGERGRVRALRDE